MQHSIKIPNNMQAIYQAIIDFIIPFCKKHLNDEYLQLSQYLTAALCRKKPSPLLFGPIRTWAAAIIYALGSVNFLFDKTNKPHMNATELAKEFGMGKSTISAKAKQIRDLLKMHQFNHHWTLPSLLERSSMAWMIMLDGFIVDARTLPLELQKIAYDKGLIPYIHAQTP
jgi:hypothetical protein